MVRHILITITTLTILSATVINVPADYSTIQEGINASVEGDTVLVAQGNYIENLLMYSIKYNRLDQDFQPTDAFITNFSNVYTYRS